MRRLIIHQTDSDAIELLDNCDEELDQYCSRLSELMKMGHIAILKTDSTATLLRPSKISGIQVIEINEEENQLDHSEPDFEQVEKEVEKIQKEDEEEDIITDV